MKSVVHICIFLALAFTACKKEIPTSDVVYSITETSSASPAYDIVFTNDVAGGQMVTQYNTPSYSSGKIELQQGQNISMRVSCSAPLYSLNCNIFINGNLWKSGSFSSGGELVLSGQIPAE
jgi:hypothetical protein